jgi:hypothetical protein
MEKNDTRKGLINVDDTKVNVNIEREVSELIKRGADRASMKELRHKFGDDKVFDMIQEAYYEKLSSIRKRSIKFTKLIEKKYGMLGYPLHVILNKALKYKKKYSLSDEEFELFRQYYQKSMNMRNNTNKLNVLVPNTNMAKVFGDDPYTNNKIHTSDGDHKIIKSILELYEENRFLWQQITLQSIIYQGDLNNDKYEVSFNSNKMINFSSPTHPVVAALFLPKISNFDEYFLFTNLAYILKCKYLGEPLTTYHSYLMLYNLVTDPTDVVCNSDSPLRDILHRAILQVALWKNVLKLREGNVYDTNNSFVASDFMANIDGCKLSMYDAPDLLMIGDENVIIRRLLNAVAFRCATVISTPTIIPLFNNGSANTTMQVNTLNIPFNLTQINKVPMIYIRLPPKIIQSSTQAKTLNIQDSLTTIQTIMSNGRLESRSLSITASEQLLIISIPRRTYRPAGNSIYNLPQVFNFAHMPHHAIGLEILNDTPVATNKYLTLSNTANTANDNKFSDKLFLKSAVVLKQKKDNRDNKFIYGTKTYIINYHTQNKEIKVYNPISDIQKVDTTTNQVSMIPLRYLTSTFCNQIVRNSTGTLPRAVAPNAPGVFTSKFVTSLEEEDKIHDFLQRQTILIYTNELKPNSNVQQIPAPAPAGAGGAGAHQPPAINANSPNSHFIQHHYYNIVHPMTNQNKVKIYLFFKYIRNLCEDADAAAAAAAVAPGAGVNVQDAAIRGIITNNVTDNNLRNTIITILEQFFQRPPPVVFDRILLARLIGLNDQTLLASILYNIIDQNITNVPANLFEDILQNKLHYINNPITPASQTAGLLNVAAAPPAVRAGLPPGANHVPTHYYNFNSPQVGNQAFILFNGGEPLREGNEGNQQLNDIKQFTVSKYVGDITYLSNNTTYMIEDPNANATGAAAAGAAGATAEVIGILKTDIGLVPAHF